MDDQKNDQLRTFAIRDDAGYIVDLLTETSAKEYLKPLEDIVLPPPAADMLLGTHRPPVTTGGSPVYNKYHKYIHWALFGIDSPVSPAP